MKSFLKVLAILVIGIIIGGIIIHSANAKNSYSNATFHQIDAVLDGAGRIHLYGVTITGGQVLEFSGKTGQWQELGPDPAYVQ